MDILTHALVGSAAGTGVAAFSKGGRIERLGIICISGLGGALSDIDAISLWSGFDRIFGRIFELTHSGRDIYSAKLWYSHHGFFHSIAAALFFAVLAALVVLSSRLCCGVSMKDAVCSLKKYGLLFSGFLCGYFLHLLGDLPTPSSSWGGVRLFWPAGQYVGGHGEIWWWNNYDIFLIAAGTVLVNAAVLLLQRGVKIGIRMIMLPVLAAALVLCVFQIKTRGFDFNYAGRTVEYQQYEAKSKEIQRRILGIKVYAVMARFDGILKINF